MATTVPRRLRATTDSADLASFGYAQSLHRRLHFFSSFAAAFSYISPATGIFTLFILGVGTLGGAFIWTFPVVARGPVHRRAVLRRGLEPLPDRRLGVPVDEVPQPLEAVRVVLRLDLPVGRRADDRRRRRDAAADADPDAQRHRHRHRPGQPHQPEVGRGRHARRDHAAEHLRRARRRADQQHRRAVRAARPVRVRDHPRAVPQQPGRRRGLRHRRRRPSTRRTSSSRCSWACS